MAVFDELNALNINGHTEQKKVEGKMLTYLSWPWAWAEIKKRFPEASYEVWRNANGLPYTEDPITGYMVTTSVTIGGVTHEMWLPVMDGKNRAMKREPYDYTTQYGKKHVEAATMMDINKTIMRCLVKNLAMFGLGLYIYAGEDLPEAEQGEAPAAPVTNSVTKVTEVPRENGTVKQAAKVPEIPKKEEQNPQMTPVMEYLLKCMADMREMRQISAAENNKLFKAQRDALVKKKLAPNKNLAEYTMEEALALIDAMYRCFDPTGTELKTE
jgi:hypothetical protein